MKDQQFEQKIDEIVHNSDLTDMEKRVAAGKTLRGAIERLKSEGKSNAEIAELTGIRESRVHELAKSYEAHEQSIIWFPGIYSGREGVYAQKVRDVTTAQIIELVQARAKEDGEWAIENDHVGGNEDKMRKMMAWVSNPVNIRQCVDHIHREGLDHERTVDWICRDLANASKWIGGAS